MSNIKKSLAVVTALTMLSACSGQMNAQNARNGGITSGTAGVDKSDMGTVLGGVGGAVIGSSIGGHGHGGASIAGGIIGGLLGAGLGHEVGASLDRADMSYYDRTSQRALETQPAGQPLPWRNPQSGNSGTITPQAPYKTSEGQYCREYTQSINVGGQTKNGYGTACRQPDGSWQIIQ